MDRLFLSYENATFKWAEAFPKTCGDLFIQQSPITIPPIEEIKAKSFMNNSQLSGPLDSILSEIRQSTDYPRRSLRKALAYQFSRMNNAPEERYDIPRLVCSDENPCDEFAFYETIGLHDKYVGSELNEYSMIGLDLDTLNTRHPTLHNGPMGVDYELKNIHFHLGPAEHPIQGNDLKIDATIHAVHYNKDVNKYAVIEHQLHFDSDSPIDLELKCSDVCNCCGKSTNECEMRSIVPKTDMNYCSLKEGEVLKRNNFNKIETKKASWLQWLEIESNDLSGYVTYNGGLTTPPCDQDVTFYINPVPVRVKPFGDCGPLNEALNANVNINGGNSRPPMPILYGTKIEIV